MLFYYAAVDLSRPRLNYAAGIVRRRRRAIRSRWRLLNPGRQALPMLADLRKTETFGQLAAGFGASEATAWRYAEEAVVLLPARSPKLTAALRKARIVPAARTSWGIRRFVFLVGAHDLGVSLDGVGQSVEASQPGMNGRPSIDHPAPCEVHECSDADGCGGIRERVPLPGTGPSRDRQA